MSGRARGYLAVAAAHFTLIGSSVLVFPQMYAGAAFIPLVELTKLWVWGCAYLITGILCTLAAVTRWPTFARAGLIGAFIVLIVSAFAVGWGVVWTWFDADPSVASPIIPLSFTALAIKDLLMVEQPLRTPAEDYAEARAELEVP
jgi:hypothetical protein